MQQRSVVHKRSNRARLAIEDAGSSLGIGRWEVLRLSVEIGKSCERRDPVHDLERGVVQNLRERRLQLIRKQPLRKLHHQGSDRAHVKTGSEEADQDCDW